MSKHNHKYGNSGAQPAGEAQADNVDAGAAAEETGNCQAGAESELTPAEQIRELEIKLAELNDQYLRKAADFENFRKRMNREKQELTEFANQSLLLDLLPVIDDFERAIKSAETAKDFTAFFEGIIMIQKQLSTQLENKWGLKSFNSEGELFDPNRHEAIQMEKAAGIAEAVVKEDYVKGYYLRDRVIRCAKVKVLMPQEGETEAAGGDSPGQ